MIDSLTARRVAAFTDRNVRGYPLSDVPFGPVEKYPEYPFDWPVGGSGDGAIYRLVRGALKELGLDPDNFGQPSWNPLGEFIRPGDTVLVKPNWVLHQGKGTAPAETLFVNGSLIRPVLDYVSIALKARGRIILADAPLQSADFGLIMEQAQVPALAGFWARHGKPSLEIRDLRREVVSVSHSDRILSRLPQQGDPDGYQEVDLGLQSHLTGLDDYFRRFRVTDYQPVEMAGHHYPGTHKYLIANSLLGSDAVINLAKLKTHRKGGLTCALKNVVGTVGNKDWLPHHRLGSPAEGGDEYRRRSLLKSLCARLSDRMASATPGGLAYGLAWHFRRLCAAAARLTVPDNFSEGSWHGNDTLWRTILDLNTVMLYGNDRGELSDFPVRRHLAIVDAVVAGEGDGPLNSSPRREGMLLAGANSLAVDAVAACLLGFDPGLIPVIARGFEPGSGSKAPPLAGFAREEVEIVSNEPAWNGQSLAEPRRIGGRLDFAPAPGWKGQVELERPKV